MVHAVSTSYLRFEHMSPPAAGMALLLHASVALALYLVSPLKLSETPSQEPIEVTVERPNQAAPSQPDPSPPPQPAPTDTAQRLPPPPPPAATRPQASAGSPSAGLTPPEAKTHEKPAQLPPETSSEPEPSSPPTTETAAVEKSLPAVETPRAPLSMQDFVRIAPPPPPQEIARPTLKVAPPPQQRQQLPNSPITALQRHETPQTSNNPSPSMVNPAAAAQRGRVIDEYKWAVIRKFSQYLPNLREKGEGGTLVMTITIARDGRLVDVTINQSSGIIPLDRGMVDAIRAASPYPPLPVEVSGDRFTFVQDITAQR